jgi:hypothetical protein
MFSTLTKNETLFTTVFDDKYEASIGFYEKMNGQYEKVEILGEEINKPNCFDAHPNIALDESFIIFDSKRPEGDGLYISFKNKDGMWTPAQYMGKEYEGASVSTFSPDGRYLFFMKHRDIYWVDAKIIEELKPDR